MARLLHRGGHCWRGPAICLDPCGSRRVSLCVCLFLCVVVAVSHRLLVVVDVRCDLVCAGDDRHVHLHALMVARCGSAPIPDRSAHSRNVACGRDEKALSCFVESWRNCW